MAQIRSLKTGIKFKDTPIGKVPVDWEVTQLGDICEVIGGSTPSTVNKENWNGNILWATPTDITALKGRLIDGTKQKITEKGLASCGTKVLPEGTILMTSRATIGACAINTKPMATNQGFASLACKEKGFNWFIYYLVAQFRNELERLSSGSTFREVSKKSVKSLYLPLPPLPEQNKIAEILSNVDDAIEETDRIIEKTIKLKKGLMQTLLTRGIGHKKFKKMEIGEIPEKWEISRLGDLCAGKPEYGANTSAIDRNDSLPRYIRITDVTTDGYLLEKTWQSINRDVAAPYFLKEGDFLFARSGATVGKTYLYHKEDGECAFAGYMIRFRPTPSKLLPEFLFQFTHSNFYYQWVKGMLRAGAQPNINGKEYSDLVIPTPPITEQKNIVKILSSIDKEIRNEVDRKQQLETLKKSLMQVLLTGKVRVKVA